MNQQQLIDILNVCCLIKKDFDKYCNFDMIIEGDLSVTKNNSIYDFTIKNCSEFIGTDLLNSTFKNGEYLYILKNGKIDHFEYIKRLHKIFNINDIGINNFYDTPSISFFFEKYNFTIEENLVYCFKSFLNNMIFIYDFNTDKIIDINQLYENTIIKINHDNSTTIYMNAFDNKFIIYTESITNIINFKLQNIKVTMNGRSICDYRKMSSSLIHIESEVIRKMLDELESDSNQDKLGFIIQVLKKYCITHMYDGMNMITVSGTRIPMTKELYDNFKNLDEKSILDLYQSLSSGSQKLEQETEQSYDIPSKKIRRQ